MIMSEGTRMRPTGQLLGFKLTSESPAPSLEPLARLERGPGVGSRLSDCGLVPHTPDRLPGRGRPGWALRALGRLGRRRGRHGTCTGPRQWLRPAACPSQGRSCPRDRPAGFRAAAQSSTRI